MPKSIVLANCLAAQAGTSAASLNGFNDLDSEGFTSYINSSAVEHIYINQFYEMNCNPSAFDNLNLTNGFT